MSKWKAGFLFLEIEQGFREVASGSDASEGGANEGFASEDALQFFLNS